MTTVSQLAFPYTQTASADVLLNRLILLNDEGTSKHVFKLAEEDARHCVGIENIQVSTEISKETSLPVSYIDNQSENAHNPLLVRCDPLNHKIKLNLSVSCSEADSAKSLYIVKTIGKYSADAVLTSLEGSPKFGDGIEISQVRYSQLPLDLSIHEPQNVIVNDAFTSANFHNGVLNLYLFKGEKEKFTHLFDVAVWVDELHDVLVTPSAAVSPVIGAAKRTTKTSNSKDLSLQFVDYRMAFNFVLDDGPEFRSILNKYEQLIPSIQKNTSILMEEIKSMNMNLKRLLRNKAKVYELIRSFSNLNPILSRFGFKEDFKAKLDLLFGDFEIKLNFFLDQVCETKLLEKIKAISVFDDEKTEIQTLKKNFEHNSKDFYNWLKKYLSNEKDRPESKLLLKRKKFELSKFDYMNHLNNFTNNQYINEFFENLFKFVSIDISDVRNIPKDFNKTPVNNNYRIFLNALLNFNTEKFKLRQMIESCRTNDELTNLVHSNNLTIENASNDDVVVTQDNVGQIFSPISSSTDHSETSNSTARDSSETNATEDVAEKSGILYALGGKGKQGWHKEWVVVKDGQLKEYSDWRTGSDPINVPIHIALSNIKPTTHDKRQNCFEIFTAQGNKYTFQAMDAQERDKWIRTIENARQLVNTDKLQENLGPSYTIDSHAGHSHSKMGKKLLLKLEKPKVIKPNDNVMSPVSVSSNSLITQNYYKVVRAIPDSNNHICADCGSLESVEWVSLNFLVVLCINCSSFHRKMGSHVSKIKSLKLDNFNKETEVLLAYVNNKSHNEILEAMLDFDKAKLADYEARLEFTMHKYTEKKYMQTVDDVNELLLKAIQAIDVKDTVKYTIMGGDINALVQLKTLDYKITLFEYSLRKALVVETESTVKKLFVISEFLALNGCKINKINKEMNIPEDAFKFWETKLR